MGEPCYYVLNHPCENRGDLHFFCGGENSVLTTQARWERLVSSKLTELGANREFHPLILDILEVMIPMSILLAVSLFAFRK